MNRSAIERPTIESRGVILHCRKEEQTQRLESVTIQQQFRSISPRMIVFAATPRGMGGFHARGYPIWRDTHVSLRAPRPRIARNCARLSTDLRRKYRENRWMDAIDRSRDWSSPMKNRRVTSVHDENENEPIERKVVSIDRPRTT